jgi:4-amino-4-deoxy-L-arabinose transferase-like glycosyltransferase
MLSRINFRYLLAAVLLLGFTVRLIFIFSTEQVPVMWDARIYSSAALGLIGYISEPGDRFGHPEKISPADSVQSQAHFNKTMKKYIKGERIEWSYYKTPMMARAQHYVFLSGPTLPLYLAAIFTFDVGNDFMMVRFLNVIVDIVCMLLLMLIAVRLFDKRIALLAGLLYLFYPPFIQLTGVVSTEPLTILLILLTFYFMLSWYDKNNSRFLYLCGVTLGLLVLTKPTGVLLFIPFALGFLYDGRGNIKQILPHLIKAAIPFTIVILPWVIITSIYFGTPSIRDPNYSTANFRSSSSAKFEGYDLDYTDVDFWIRPVFGTIMENPLDYGELLVKKFIRLWNRPDNDYRRTFILPLSMANVYHFIIVITALFGIFMFLIYRKKGLIVLFLIPAYYTLIHVIFHSLARYNLNPMPIMMIASAAAMITVYDYFRGLIISGAKNKRLIRLLLFIPGILYVLFFPDQPVIDLFGGHTGVIILLISKLIMFAAMVLGLCKIISESHGYRRTIKLIAVPSVVLILVMTVRGSAPDRWAEWRCRFERPEQAAGVRIYIPDEFRLLSGDLVRIGIDMITGKDRKKPVRLTTDGTSSDFYFNRPPLTTFYYQKGTYDVFEIMLGLDKGMIRAWAFVPLNPAVFNSILDEKGYIEIAVSNGETTDNYIDVFGNYPVAAKGRELIPSLSHNSIERFIEKDDPRIWTDYFLSSDSAISYYI